MGPKAEVAELLPHQLSSIAAEGEGSKLLLHLVRPLQSGERDPTVRRDGHLLIFYKHSIAKTHRERERDVTS